MVELDSFCLNYSTRQEFSFVVDDVMMGILQVSASVLRLAGLDVFSRLHQP